MRLPVPSVPAPLHRLERKREAVRNFVPSWFTVVMSTGILAQLIGTFPYAFPHMLEVGWAFWWLAVGLFIAFAAMFIGRFVFFWQDGLRLFNEPFQALFLGTIPMSLCVIINGFPTFLIHFWDEDDVMQAAVVFWWIAASLGMLCTLLLPFYMFTQHRYHLENITAVWLLPFLPCVVASGSGGMVARYAPLGESGGVIYMSYMLWGIGLPLCFMVMTMYFRRLIMHSLPPSELVVSSFLPVGPMGMSSLALMNLGSAVMRHYPPAMEGDFAAARDSGSPNEAFQKLYEHATAAIVVVAGIIVAVILFGCGIWWLVVAIASIAKSWKTMRFTMGWWGFVFPLGVFTSSANEMWRRLPAMEAMRVVATILICCVFLLWCMNMGFTLVLGWRGDLFYAPCLHRTSKELPSRNGSHAVRECDLLQQLDCAVAGGGAAGAHASTPSSDASHGHAK